MVHELSDSLDRKKQVDIAVLDFSRPKAFDKVSHTHLAIKLDYYGIRGSTSAYTASCPWVASQTVNVTSGVPQGSVLGPILFSIYMYINDLSKSLASKIRHFADDAIVYNKIKSVGDCQILQEELAELTSMNDCYG